MPNDSFSQLTPHIHRLDLNLGLGATVAVFLVRGPEGWTIIDTGLETQVDRMMAATLAYTQGERPQRLILTHGHPDHAGGAARIRAEWRLKVAAGRHEIPYLTEPVFYCKIPASPLYYLATLFGQPALLGMSVDLPLDEKQVIDGLTVYHVTGHAPGMIALLHRADRALLCADTFATLGGRLGDPLPFYTYDPRLNRRAQAKLALLDFDHLAPSHGPAIMRTGKQAALAYAEKRLGKLDYASTK